MVQVKFKKFGSNTAFGGFAPGDVLRVGIEMAAHLVEQDIAFYVETQRPAAVIEDKPEPIATRKVRGK